MFKFIYANSAMVDEVIYILCGIVCIMTGIRGLKNKKAPIGTFVFWTLLGILFGAGKFIIDSFEHGGAIIGGCLMLLGALTLTNQVQIGEFNSQSEEQKNRLWQKGWQQDIHPSSCNRYHRHDHGAIQEL